MKKPWLLVAWLLVIELLAILLALLQIVGGDKLIIPFC